MSFKDLEEKILLFWKERKIFQKSINQREGASYFVFYEGPPTANGRPGLHHVLARTIKDLVCRYKTMAGFQVLRKAGWDTHGIPVELEIEKELGFRTKQDIENYGIANFIKKCKESVWAYKEEWDRLTERIGYWLDLDNPYITYQTEYIESLWWILKEIWKKKLLYKDYKVVPYCPRCGTPLSSHEVAQGYKTIKEPAIYLKFSLSSEKFPNTYLLVWTTTPWTLPANVAIAVNPELAYVKVKVGEEHFILAKARLGVLKKDYQVEEEFLGKELIGLNYHPIFNFEKLEKKAFFVVTGNFVSAEEGTGLVHIAPAFGEEDLEVGKVNDLPILITVNEEGEITVGPWKGLFIKKADPLIIEDLEKRGILYSQEDYEHDYPFCWRCKTPLLYYITTSWFIRMTAVQKKLLENNQSINWVPAHLKEGRFGEWLKNIKDWALSRQRYWGTPLPIWICQQCQKEIIVGSLKELEELSINHQLPKNEEGEIDLHRPYIDEIRIKCPDCQGLAQRVPEVIDVWFDSGGMPFAQYHYPFENKELQEKQFPADFIAEGMDQTRGWFYTLLAISTLLDKGIAYKNVVSHGLLLDEKGKKMSKSLGNIIMPADVINVYGADALRFYILNSPAPEGDYILFSLKGLDEIYKKVNLLLLNIFNFYQSYFKNLKIPSYQEVKENIGEAPLLDQWLISRFSEDLEKITDNLENYQITPAARIIKNFVNDFSIWYLKLSRERFKEGDKGDYFGFVLQEFSKILAPFMPFLAEYLYQNLEIKNKKESVHLENWPNYPEFLINYEVLKKMDLTKQAIEIGLALRAKEKIKIRQPLAKIYFRDKEILENAYLNLVKQELNVKEILLGEEDRLDVVINEELKKEGLLRELSRQINQFRKEKGLKIEEKNFSLVFATQSQILKELLNEQKEFLKNRCALLEIKENSSLQGKELDIEGEKIKIELIKIS